MKKWSLTLAVVLSLTLMPALKAFSQCSICTKTSMQQGEKAGRGMNGGILYLMLMPIAIMGFVGYRWWVSERNS